MRMKTAFCLLSLSLLLMHLADGMRLGDPADKLNPMDTFANDSPELEEPFQIPHQRHHRKARKYNSRPIIGIFTEEVPKSVPPFIDPSGHPPVEYIAASYVKFVEAAGARVMPVRFNQSKSDLRELFGKLNGVLLPGGDQPLTHSTPFFQAGKVLYEYIQDDPTFPIIGICLGFEFIATLAAGTNDVITGPFKAENISYNLDLTKHAFRSDLFGRMLKSDKMYDAMLYDNITYNSHGFGVTPDDFYKYPGLYDHYDILATSTDDNNKEFVAAIEHRDRLIYGVQFHPEKNVFEWYSNANIPHSSEAIRFSQQIADMFVDKARLNFNKFDLTADKEADMLIETNTKLFLGNKYFQEVYVFYDQPPPPQAVPREDLVRKVSV